MNSLEITEKRNIAIEKMQNIVNNCKSELREMTDEEKQEFENCKAEISMLKEELSKLKETLSNYDSEVDNVENEQTQENKLERNKSITVMENKEFKLIRAINDIANNRTLSEEYRNYIAEGENEMRTAGLAYSGQIQLRGEILAGTATQGQEAVAEDKMNILTAIKNNLVLTEAGATFMTGLVGNVSIPVYDGSNCAWADETAEATDGAGTFTEVELTPKRLTAFVDISKQMLNQASDDVEAMLRNDLINAISQKLESTILGSGAGSANTPAGLANGSVIAEANTFAKVLEIEEGFEGKNYGNKVWVVSPRAKSTLKAKDKGTDTGNYLIQNGELDGYKVICSANVPESHFYFGDFSDLVIGQWGAIDITVDPYSQASKGKIRIVVNAYFDAKLRRKSSVVAAKTIA